MVDRKWIESLIGALSTGDRHAEAMLAQHDVLAEQLSEMLERCDMSDACEAEHAKHDRLSDLLSTAKKALCSVDGSKDLDDDEVEDYALRAERMLDEYHRARDKIIAAGYSGDLDCDVEILCDLAEKYPDAEASQPIVEAAAELIRTIDMGWKERYPLFELREALRKTDSATFSLVID